MKFFKNFLKHYEVTEADQNIEDRLSILEEKYQNLLKDLVRLEEERIETDNCLYEIMNSIDAVDARIDILTCENFLKEKNET